MYTYKEAGTESCNKLHNEEFHSHMLTKIQTAKTSPLANNLVKCN